jgi:uncharacterized protein
MATAGRNDPALQALTHAIRAGDFVALEQLLSDHPGLASTRIPDGKGGSCTALHVATDWPGYFPNGPEVVRLLIAGGADPNAQTTGGRQPETPLHWAASSDDSDVAAELINGGADIETPGGSIGTPLGNAVGYGCWHVARLLAERGAKIDTLWIAAALGKMPLVTKLLAADPEPAEDDLNEAFWQACHGGQRRVAEYLLARGADINATPGYSGQTPLDIAASPDTRRELLHSYLRGQGAVTTADNT